MVSIVAALILGCAAGSTIAAIVLDPDGCHRSGSGVTHGPGAVRIPGVVHIASYPDAGCDFPFRGVAGVLESVGDGRVLYISNCHNLHLLHSVDPDVDSVQSTPVSSNLAAVIAPTDTLKFAAFDRGSNKVYISFLRQLSTICVSLSIVVCAFGASPLGDTSSATCAILYDSETVDPACGSMNTHATGAQLMTTGTHLLFTVGDLLQNPSQAQNDNSFWGKIWRAPLGKEPLERGDFSMLSKGHRNPQGLCAIDNNLVLETEHGPKGGDEVNVLALDTSQVADYGWPAVSYGDHYNGDMIPDQHAPLYTEPIAFFPYDLVGSHGIGVCETWDGYHLIASLEGHTLYAATLDSRHNMLQMAALDVGYRIRSIARIGDCFAMLLTESENYEQGPLMRVRACDRNMRWSAP